MVGRIFLQKKKNEEKDKIKNDRKDWKKLSDFYDGGYNERLENPIRSEFNSRALFYVFYDARMRNSEGGERGKESRLRLRVFAKRLIRRGIIFFYSAESEFHRHFGISEQARWNDRAHFTPIHGKRTIVWS